MDRRCSSVREEEEEEEGLLLLLPHGGRPSTPPFHFPPPPPYPPPALLLHHDYAYASSAPSFLCPPPERRRPAPTSKHSFISTYGVEENIYEEICEARGAFENPYEFAGPEEDEGGHRPAVAPRPPAAAAGAQKGGGGRRRSATEAEVAKVRRGHRRVLGELNLAVEAMLMPQDAPPASSAAEEEDDDGDRDGANGIANGCDDATGRRRLGAPCSDEGGRRRPSTPGQQQQHPPQPDVLEQVNGRCFFLEGRRAGPPRAHEASSRAKGRAALLMAGWRRLAAANPSKGTNERAGARATPAPPLAPNSNHHPHRRGSRRRRRGAPPSPHRRSHARAGGERAAGTIKSETRRRNAMAATAVTADDDEGEDAGDPGEAAVAMQPDEPRWDECCSRGGAGCRAAAAAPAASTPCRAEESGMRNGGGCCLRSRELTRQPCSETDSWGSAAESDRPLSSLSCSSSTDDDEEDEEDDGETSGARRRAGSRLTSSFDEHSCASSAPTTIAARASGNLRSTLNKARTLCDKWRESRGRGREGGVVCCSSAAATTLPTPPEHDAPTESRLSRWFSIRRNQYDVDRGGGGKLEGGAVGTATAPPHPALGDGGGMMPLLAEEECDDAASVIRASFSTGSFPSGRARTIAAMTVSPADVSAAFPPFPSFQRRHQPPALPPPPPGLSPEQIKRRHIVAAIVHSENSYVASLQRLANDYKKPLEESSPPILSAPKIATLFHRVPEILQCHTLFRIALTESVRNWDREESLGDVFVASFSKAVVLEIYSDFINNFSVAMDLAKQESKRKSALADFLKVKQISAHDRLSFFGLMVKPVQRFPQFILFLQDLLKHTPQGHHDRMSLQLALTQLESLAEMLNERKREAEQYQAFREMLRHVGGKFAARPLVSDGTGRYLLREDNVTQLAFNQSGMITKTKPRRLLLLNDLLVCVSVTTRSSDDFGGGTERLALKWTHPVTDIEVLDASASPTLSRLLTACGGGGGSRGGSLKSERSADGVVGAASSSSASSSTMSSLSNAFGVDDLCQEMNALMHDYEVVSRIADLISTLKGSYMGMTLEGAKQVLASIQSSIQHKDEEIAWVDSCCLQIALRGKSGKEDQLTFQTDNPSVKKEWATELRLAQLALDPNNSPAWDIPEQERRPSTKMPLFVRAMPIFRSLQQTEVICGCFYTIWAPTHGRRRRSPKAVSYLWVCSTTDGVGSHVSISSVTLGAGGSGLLLKALDSFDLVAAHVTCVEHVGSLRGGVAGDTVWVALSNCRLIVYNAREPEKQEEILSTTLPAVATQIKHHCDQVFVALANGSLLLFLHGVDEWCLQDPQVIPLASRGPVTCLLPIDLCLYAASGKVVWALSALTGEVQRDFRVQHEHLGDVSLMAHSGIGLWLSFCASSTICLYHTETFKHLQDISVAASVARVVSSGRAPTSPGAVHVTALVACRGLLWVGTNVGVVLTIPLPRLEGVPIISGRVNISHHAHCGPITFLLPLLPKPLHCLSGPLVGLPHIVEEGGGKEARTSSTANVAPPSPDNNNVSVESNPTSSLGKGSPVAVVRRRSSPRRGGGVECQAGFRRASKTLPRGLGGCTWSAGGSQDYDVYGLYGELMNIRDYEGEGGGGGGSEGGGGKGLVSGDGCQLSSGATVNNCLSSAGMVSTYEKLRRSDPELAAIPAKVSTLDRRLKMKVCRPRSLDLSDWSMDSRSSSAYTSSGSEESMPVVVAPQRPQDENSKVSSSCGEGGGEEGSRGVQKQAPVHHQVQLQRPNGIKVMEGPRTIIMLMGGRGYVDWRRIARTEKGSPSPRSEEVNTSDAHIVVWEMKV